MSTEDQAPPPADYSEELWAFVRAVATLEDDWLGSDEGGCWGYDTEKVRPLIKRAEELLKHEPDD